MYKLVGTQLSLFTTFHVFFFQFIFVLPAKYVRMHSFMGKSKQAQVVYLGGIRPISIVEIYVDLHSKS